MLQLVYSDFVEVMATTFGQAKEDWYIMLRRKGLLGNYHEGRLIGLQSRRPER